ncbi:MULTISPECIES: response regulator [unclassified Janibacter]|uniref:response regulator transcription factor n=1 Tax=unclassified Janibacter TaxID=2649294 RepID=UPI003CFDC126
MTIRVHLVDDHAAVRQAMAHLIGGEEGFEVVGQSGSLAQARADLAGSAADVLVIDVNLPDGSGLDLVEECRTRSESLGLVVLTMLDDDATLLRALDAGASALVLKTAPAEQVFGAIVHAHRSPSAFSAEGLSAALRRRRDAPPELLTPREREVVAALLAGYSVDQVATRLYMSRSTVKTHVGKVYDKLGVHNRAGLAVAAVKHGIAPRE